jgi:hypothetical protein
MITGVSREIFDTMVSYTIDIQIAFLMERYRGVLRNEPVPVVPTG